MGGGVNVTWEGGGGQCHVGGGGGGGGQCNVGGQSHVRRGNVTWEVNVT